MMKYEKLFSALFLLVFLSAALSGCRLAYIPNKLNVPLLTEESEMRASINPRNIQLAYSPRPNIGLMANGYYNFRRVRVGSACFFCDDGGNYTARQHQSLVEAAAGYYRSVKEGSPWSVEVYGGYGIGTNIAKVKENIYDFNSNQSFVSERRFSATNHRFFVQPAIGYVKRIVELSFAVRVSSLYFNNVRFNEYTQHEIEKDGLNNIGNQFRYLTEPAFTLRVGPEYVKLELQAGFTVPVPQFLKGGEDFVGTRGFANTSLYFILAPRYKNASSGL